MQLIDYVCSSSASSSDDSRIVTKLLPHQMTFLGRGLAMEANGHGGLNASDMGTGKTLMMLALHAVSPQ